MGRRIHYILNQTISDVLPEAWVFCPVDPGHDLCMALAGIEVKNALKYRYARQGLEIVEFENAGTIGKDNGKANVYRIVLAWYATKRKVHELLVIVPYMQDFADFARPNTDYYMAMLSEFVRIQGRNDA